MKNYYELLGVPPASSAEEVKRAFRQQIARYHPDKVQHLGTEFQEMAATRAAELTEAYRILSHDGRRADYDAQRTGQEPAVAVATHAPQPAADPATRHSDARTEARRESDPAGRGQAGPQPEFNPFHADRQVRDTFVRKATMDRFRQAFAEIAGSNYEESRVRGFDFAGVPRLKLFARGRRSRLLGRFVSSVDRASVADAWLEASRWEIPAGEDICVILMGTAVAPQRELADAIAEQRRRPARGAKVTLIPVNLSVWDAHMPVDAPPVAKDLLARLRAGN